jgi:hypothetical protein
VRLLFPSDCIKIDRGGLKMIYTLILNKDELIMLDDIFDFVKKHGMFGKAINHLTAYIANEVKIQDKQIDGKMSLKFQ